MTDSVSWNYAEVFEAVVQTVPQQLAQVCGDRRFSWQQFNERANALAADFLEVGLGEQAKVAAYLTNGPEYLETYFAAFKAGMVPVNTNFRYGPDEIRYLFDNADAEAVVFHAAYAPLVEKVKADLPAVRRWYVVDDPGAPGSGERDAPWAMPYESVVGENRGKHRAENVRGSWGVSGDHQLFLYTGGTTGMPKGVMWRQDDCFNVLGRGGHALLQQPPIDALAEISTRTVAVPPVMLPACPLMHGTGQFSAFITLALGGCVVTNPNRSFHAEELWDIVEREAVTSLVIVGDAFAKPLLAALDASPSRWQLGKLMMMSSSGVMWSQETKQGLLEHLPQVVLVDSYGSSEAVGLGASASTKGNAVTTATFQLGPSVHVFTDDNRRVEPGSDEVGFVAISGFVPMGYYKDPEKSAKTFRTIDGVRYSVPGDFAQVNPDGTLHLLGRGSVCINTGGEKVFPEEVEELLKLHGHVADAVCVGIPDDRFGEVICAVIELSSAAKQDGFDQVGVLAAVSDRLAKYKTPRHVVVVDSIGRSPAGKVDYNTLTGMARSQLLK
jgi:3-oxocholest-4-en-26-oate---CoA ligase